MERAEAPSSVASQRIADFVRDAIIEGHLAPGERIKQEELAAQFGASRLPVREALRILEKDGLVTLVANSGAWVSRLNLDECIEVYRIREHLEPLLLADSIGSLDAEHFAELDRLSMEIEFASEGDMEAFLALDRSFHLLTYAGAHTTTLGPLVERMWNSTHHYRRAYTRLITPDRRWVLYYEHRLLIDALRRGNLEEAQSVLRNHIRRTATELVDHPEIFGP
jgi:DNA-binding GntR family transcriptional regulator